MNDHPDWCDQTDDPEFAILRGSGRPVALTIRCSTSKHRIGSVYNLDGVRFLALPGFTFRARDMEIEDADKHGDDDAHAHSVVVRIDEEAPDRENQFQRCKCGTSLLRISAVKRALELRHTVMKAGPTVPNTVR